MKAVVAALMLAAGLGMVLTAILDPGRVWTSIAGLGLAIAWFAFAAFKFAEYRASKRDTLQGIEK